MKRTFTLIALALATLTVQTTRAQVQFGLKGGLNVTDMSFNSSVFNTSNRTGFFIGPTIKFTLPLVGLGVDASALYDQREADVEYGTPTTIFGNAKLKQQSVNIPINLRYGIGLGSVASIFLAAGPQFGFNVGDKSKIIDNVDTEWKLKSSNFSLNFGAGVMLLKHLQIGANYNVACGKTGDVNIRTGLLSAKDEIDGKHRARYNTWQISAAYYF